MLKKSLQDQYSGPILDGIIVLYTFFLCVTPALCGLYWFIILSALEKVL